MTHTDPHSHTHTHTDMQVCVIRANPHSSKSDAAR